MQDKMYHSGSENPEFNTTINKLIEHHSLYVSNGFNFPSSVVHKTYGLPAPPPSSANSCAEPPSSRSEKDGEELLAYVCGKCGLEFNHEVYFEQHLTNVHKELQTPIDLKMNIVSNSRAQCLICGAQVRHSALRDLQMHYLRHMKHKMFKCKCHDYYFQDRPAALLHLTSLPGGKKEIVEELRHTHENKNYKCKDGAPFDPIHPETGIGYKCSECGCDFIGEDAWKSHCNEEHDLKSIQGLNMTRTDSGEVGCNECGHIISGKWDTYKLRRHKLTHSPFKAFYCRLCMYSRKRKDDVLVHVRHEHAGGSGRKKTKAARA